MLEGGALPVKPKCLPHRGICRLAGGAADCPRSRPGALSLTAFYVLLPVLALGVLLLVALRRRGGRRQRAMARLLDAADALEERLRTARAEIEAIAGSDGNPVLEAMQEMLRQRLWLQQHGHDATVEQLEQVRHSIDEGRRRIDQQLARIEQARLPTAP